MPSWCLLMTRGSSGLALNVDIVGQILIRAFWALTFDELHAAIAAVDVAVRVGALSTGRQRHHPEYHNGLLVVDSGARGCCVVPPERVVTEIYVM